MVGPFALSSKKSGEYDDDYEEMIDTLVAPLGDLACEDILFSHATTPRGFARVARSLLAEGYRLMADLTYGGDPRYVGHAVGLLPVGGEGSRVTLVSTHIPKCLSGIVTLEEVGAHIAITDEPRRKEYPFNQANLWALPPVD